MAIEYGVQPLDALLTELALSNADLVGASTKQLSFKAVQKARKGRSLTPHMQKKVLEALRALKPERNFALKDLFNY
ncbi:MAG: hypothetical protein WCO69_06455 [Candidatus Omnitrophota bacterium]